MKSHELRTIGFIGLGNMGGRMAKNLHNAGYPLIGYDIDAAKCTALAATGAAVGQDTAEVVGCGIALVGVENLGHFDLQ